MAVGEITVFVRCILGRPDTPRTALLRLRLTRTVRAGLRIQTGIRNDQSLYRLIAADVRVENLIHIAGGHVPIPNGFRINDHSRAVLALVKTAGLVSPYPRLKPALRQPCLEKAVQRRRIAGIAAPFGILRRALVGANEDVFLEFGHTVKSLS